MCSLIKNRYLFHFFVLCGESIVTYDKSNVSNVSEACYRFIIKGDRLVSALNILFSLDLIKKV